MRYACLFIVLGLLCGANVQAQSPAIRNLEDVLANTTDNRTQCDLLHQLAAESWDYNFEASLTYAKRCYTLARKINYLPGISLSLTDMGSYYFYKGDYALALNYYHQALSASAEVNPPPHYLAETYIRMANIQRVRSEFDSSELYFSKAEVCLRGQPPGQAHGAVWHGRGLVKYELSEFSEARICFQRALNIRLALRDSMLIGESWKTLGLVLSGQAEFDSAQYYLNKTRDLALRHHNPELLIFANIHQGEIYFKKGAFFQSMQMFNNALDSLKNHPFKRYQAITLKNIGQIFEWQGDYKNALDFFYKSLAIDEALGSKQEIARTYDMMGWAHADQKDFTKALQAAEYSGSIFRAIKDHYEMSDYYTLRGYIAQLQRQYKDALKYYDSAIVIRRNANTPLALSNTLKFVADVHIAQGSFEKAEQYENEIFTLNERLNNRDSRAHYYNSMSEIQTAKKEYKEAERYALLALQEAEAIRSMPLIQTACKRLLHIYRVTRNYERAMVYSERYIAISDSLYTSTNITRQAELNALYELGRREQEIEKLNQRSLLQVASLTAQDSQIRFQNTVLVAAVLGCIMLAALAITLFRYSQSRNKMNGQLNKLNREISEQKEEIQAQSEELTEANQSLTQLNYDLIEKTEEIEAQSEELRETNEMIIEINRDLDDIVTKRTAQLKEAYKELDTFFYRSSHDFRRPLTTFMGLAEVAKVTVKDKAALELFEKVKDTARSLDKMLVKLQSISDVGAQELVYKEVLIKEIFHSVCDGFHEEMQHRGFRIHCDVSLPGSLISYPAMIRIILENLVENAIQFSTPNKPYLRLTVFQLGDQCVMELEDNGQGIPKEYETKIFEMYFRGSERSKGNGLGLYIVKKAVEKLKGSIHADPLMKIGSRFIISLPMEDDLSLRR